MRICNHSRQCHIKEGNCFHKEKHETMGSCDIALPCYFKSVICLTVKETIK